MDNWASGKCTAIAVANAVAEVRHNTVIGYQIAYGGWQMSNVHFHDNYAIEAKCDQGSARSRSRSPYRSWWCPPPFD